MLRKNFFHSLSVFPPVPFCLFFPLCVMYSLCVYEPRSTSSLHGNRNVEESSEGDAHAFAHNVHSQQQWEQPQLEITEPPISRSEG